MKILYVSKVAPHLGIPHILEVAKRFVARGHEVTVLSAATEPSQPRRSVIDGVTVIAIRTAPDRVRTWGALGFFATRLPFYVAAPFIIARKFRDVDVIIEDVAPLRSPALPSVAKRSGIPVIYQTHNAYPGLRSWTATYGLKGVCGWAWDRRFRRNPRCDALFTDARYTAESYDGIGCAVRWIPNGIDVNLYRPGTGDATAGAPLRLLAVGRAVDLKNHQILIRALAAAPVNATLRIVGDGPARLKLERLAEDLDVAARVTFTGTVDRGQLLREYQDADLFLLPSLWEGQPHAVLEALACGLPVAMSDIQAAQGQIEPEFGWKLSPQDANAWAALFREVAHHREDLIAMGRNARKNALEWPDWEQVTDEVAHLIAEVRGGTH